MALTALITPNQYSSAYNDILYRFASDGLLANPEMSLRIELYLNSVLSADFYVQYYLLSSQNVFDVYLHEWISKAFDNPAVLKSLSDEGFFNGDTSSRIDYQIFVYEYGDTGSGFGDLGDTYTGSLFTAFNFALPFGTVNDISSYIMSITNETVSKFLTDAPDSLEMDINDQIQISFLSDNNYINAIRIDSYDANDALIKTETESYLSGITDLKKIFCLTKSYFDESASYIKYKIQQIFGTSELGKDFTSDTYVGGGLGVLIEMVSETSPVSSFASFEGTGTNLENFILRIQNRTDTIFEVYVSGVTLPTSGTVYSAINCFVTSSLDKSIINYDGTYTLAFEIEYWNSLEVGSQIWIENKTNPANSGLKTIISKPSSTQIQLDDEITNEFDSIGLVIEKSGLQYSTVSEEKTIQIKCDENKPRLAWLNKYGSFDFFNFNRIFSRKVIQKTKYENNNEIKTIISEPRKIKTVQFEDPNNNTITEEMYNYITQLFDSVKAYFINNEEYEAIDITTNSIDEYDDLNGKLTLSASFETKKVNIQSL